MSNRKKDICSGGGRLPHLYIPRILLVAPGTSEGAPPNKLDDTGLSAPTYDAEPPCDRLDSMELGASDDWTGIPSLYD